MRVLHIKLYLIIAFLLVGFGAFLVLATYFIADKTFFSNATNSFVQMVESKAERINKSLLDVERSTTYLARIAANSISNPQDLNDIIYAKSINQDLKVVALNISSHTSGVYSIFLYFDQDLAGKTGFSFIKKNYFSKAELAEIDDFKSQKSKNTLALFQKAKEELKPFWSKPYDDKDIDEKVFAYIVPIIKDDVFIGIAGISLKLEEEAQIAGNIGIFAGGHGHLVSISPAQNQTEGAPRFFNMVASKMTHAMSQKVSELIIQNEQIKEPVKLEIANIQSYLMFLTLRNGMRYIVHVPRSEVFLKSELLLGRIYALICAVAVFVGFIFIINTRKMLRSARELSAATKRLAAGELDTELPDTKNIELNAIKENILELVRKLKISLNTINDLAFKDTLTGLKNRTAYTQYLQKTLKDQGEYYALAIFNVSGVKKLNDNFGKKQGDEMICLAGNFICKIFSHSPVFRLGGDEFVVVLKGNDFMNRESLFSELINQMDSEHLNTAPYSTLVLS